MDHDEASEHPAGPVAPFGGRFRGARVMITGHTGFKGAWLALWLRALGAEVAGYALPADEPSLFARAHVAEGLVHIEADVRDRGALAEAIRRHQPAIVIHMAAQSLVRRSYRDPAETWEVNVMGTVNMLEAVRACPSARAVVVVTSDKCYENREWAYAYRESDAMGGVDPYSASKGAAELAAASYRRAFFAAGGPAIATARAGNVIGGGDWAAERILPDCARALAAGAPIVLRSPESVRPWQHVLEPLSGYLWLADRLLAEPSAFAHGWNFGPAPAGHARVREVAEAVIARWGAGRWEPAPVDGPRPHEARVLRLDVTKAHAELGWAPAWGLDQAVAATVDWYRAAHADPAFDAKAASLAQIAAYTAAARAAGLAWANDVMVCNHAPPGNVER